MSNSNDNISKNVTHTQNLPPKTKSSSVSDSTTDEYKYIPGTDRPKSDATMDKSSSSGNIRGV